MRNLQVGACNRAVFKTKGITVTSAALNKNKKGETVRAFKTNTLGEFKLSTPLANGTYTLEVATNVSGVTFDIISIEAKGEPFPSIEIIGN